MLLRKKVYDLELEKYLNKTSDKNIHITIQEVMSLNDRPIFKLLIDNSDLKLRIKSVGYSGSVNEDIKHYPLSSIKDTVKRLQEKRPDFNFIVTMKPLLKANLKPFIEAYESEKEVNISFYDQLVEMADKPKKNKM